MILQKNILLELKNHLQKNYAGAIQNIILFGSQAHYNPLNDSDFDVLIILENDYNFSDENQLLELCYDIDLKFNILLDVHIISAKELSSSRGRQPIFVNALKQGIYA